MPQRIGPFDYAADVVSRLIEEVASKPVHLVGISFGGMIAQVTTLARPNLIRSLTLIGTASDFPEEVRKGMKSRAETISAGGMVSVLQSTLERWFTPETHRQRPDILDRITKTILSEDPATHAAIWDVISTLDIHARLEEIRCPTLVLVGEQDPSTPPKVAYRLAEAIQEAKIVVIPGAAHIVTVEAPIAVNEAMKAFLNTSENQS